MTMLAVVGNGVGSAGKQRKQGDVVASHGFVMGMDTDVYMPHGCKIGLMEEVR